MKKSCAKIKSMLSLYVDGELNNKQTSYINEHLVSCPECRREHELLTALVNEINNLPDMPLPKDFDSKLHLALVQASEDMRTSKKTFWQYVKPYSAVAAGVILALLVGTGYYDNFQPVDTAYIDDAKLGGIENSVVNKNDDMPKVAIDTDNTKKEEAPVKEEKTNVVVPDKKQSAPTQKPSVAPKETPVTKEEEELKSAISLDVPVAMQESVSTIEPTMAPQPALSTDSQFESRIAMAPPTTAGGGAEMKSMFSASAIFDNSEAIPQKFKAYTIASDNLDMLNEISQKYNFIKEDGLNVVYVDDIQLEDVLAISQKYGAVINFEYESFSLAANKCTIKQY